MKTFTKTKKGQRKQIFVGAFLSIIDSLITILTLGRYFSHFKYDYYKRDIFKK